ncbi:MAG: hypothetical protein EHM51_00705 [Geobacter sp.]|nr:MAG: hypothetical protein EHM51_00705 [Geobacter sp.]
MRRRIPVMMFLCQILLSFNQLVYAELYEECRASCENEFTACLEQLSPFAAIDAGLLAEKEAECKQKVEACYAGCQALPQKEESTDENEPSPPE